LGSTNFEFSIGFNKSPVEPDKLGIVGTPLTGEGPGILPGLIGSTKGGVLGSLGIKEGDTSVGLGIPEKGTLPTTSVGPGKLGIVGTPLTGEGPPGPEGIRVGLIPLGEGIVGIFILFFNGDGYIFPSRNAITLEISL
jgi:hypothetical protein